MRFGVPGTIPLACYPRLSSSKHRVVRMRKGRLDLIKLCAPCNDTVPYRWHGNDHDHRNDSAPAPPPMCGMPMIMIIDDDDDSDDGGPRPVNLKL